MAAQFGGDLPSSPTSSIIAQGLTYCAVWASGTAEADAIQQELRRRSSDHSVWRVVEGPMLDGQPNPVAVRMTRRADTGFFGDKIQAPTSERTTTILVKTAC